MDEATACGSGDGVGGARRRGGLGLQRRRRWLRPRDWSVMREWPRGGKAVASSGGGEEEEVVGAAAWSAARGDGVGSGMGRRRRGQVEQRLSGSVGFWAWWRRRWTADLGAGGGQGGGGDGADGVGGGRWPERGGQAGVFQGGEVGSGGGEQGCGVGFVGFSATVRLVGAAELGAVTSLGMAASVVEMTTRARPREELEDAAFVGGGGLSGTTRPSSTGRGGNEGGDGFRWFCFVFFLRFEERREEMMRERECIKIRKRERRGGTGM